MINKKCVAIFLAMGLIVSIGCVACQENSSKQPKQDAMGQEQAAASPSIVPAVSQVTRHVNVDHYSLAYPSGPVSSNDEVAIISLYYEDQPVGSATFVKDGATVKSAEFDANSSKIALYYPSSMLGSILNMLEKSLVSITYRTDSSGVPHGELSIQGGFRSTKG